MSFKRNNPFALLESDSDSNEESFELVVNNKKDKLKKSSPVKQNVVVSKFEPKVNSQPRELYKEKIINVATTKHYNNLENILTKEIVNLEEFGNQKLNSKWCIWFHHDPNDWTKKGYKNIATFETIEDYLQVLTHLHMVTSIKNINLYLFRENIEPTWEHEANANGGCWSIKSTMENGFDLWRNIADKVVTETLLKTFGSNDINGTINGISITNKSMNTIVKIWVSDRKVCNNQWIDKDISNQVTSKIMYQVISPER